MLLITVRALVSDRPDLINTFMVGSSLVERSRIYAPNGADWLTQLENRVKLTTTDPISQRLDQSDLFEQYSKVLRSIAGEQPLVLIIDDLQWADRGTISLLFHLARRLTSARVLLIGAYHPEEVAYGLDGARHPFEPVINELQRDFGDISIDVAQAEHRDFVEAFLDSEPNQLSLPFRDMLFRQTHGHPLFTIELLRGLQESGDLIPDPEVGWRQGPSLNWERLPARVEAAIAERIGRLPESLQAVLRAASVESGDFVAEVLARILRTDEQTMIQRLSSELDRKHHLVNAQAITRLGERRVSRYRFKHYLFQKYLYDHLDEVERAYLHEDIGKTLEEFYLHHPTALNDIAPQLAHHFQEAGLTNEAIHYLHLAGERAVQLSAYQVAATHLSKGLELLASLPESRERDQVELAVQLSLGRAWAGTKGKGNPDLINLYDRARKLCQQIGDKRQLCIVLGEMALCHFVGARHTRARELAEQSFNLAQEIGDPILVALCRWYLGVILFFLGEFTLSRSNLSELIKIYNPHQHHLTFVYLQGVDFGLSALAYDACCLWCLGYPDQADRRSQEALALAEELDHPFTLADVVCFGGCMLSVMKRDHHSLQVHAEHLERLARERMGAWQGTGSIYKGEALIMRGRVNEGVALMNQGSAVAVSAGVLIDEITKLYYLAQAHALEGRPDDGLIKIDEALTMIEQISERHYESEIYRMRGQLLIMQGDLAAGEACYHKAIEIARRQSARSWELRATLDLARLWKQQGRGGEARQKLEKIYNWFSEGFDTPDLIEAKALLEELT